jgi:hypothetical protein
MITTAEKQIAEELVDRLKKMRVMKREVLVRLGEPSELTPKYRIKELERYLKGEESEWARTEIEAEILFRQREGR